MTTPGPKELAQRAMQETRVLKKSAPPKKRLIPYAGRPRAEREELYGKKPGPKGAKK